MNVVLRVVSSQQQFIVKQARPWVHKYPQVAAPIERSEVEAAFYGLIAENYTLHQNMPNLIGFDDKQFLLVLEDLGEGNDFTYLYQQGQTITSDEVSTLTSFMSQLHRIQSDRFLASFPTNRAMKELNHEHIFKYPFLEENGFNLDDVQPGLQEVSLAYKRDNALKTKVTQLGKQYLSTGSTLLHGDYYPGSWLRTTSGISIIDPEFAFVGDPEFDVGVMIAHLTMAQTSSERIQQVLSEYESTSDYRDSLQQAFSGVEILRRIIGLAQLPVSLSLEEKSSLLEQAADWVQQY